MRNPSLSPGLLALWGLAFATSGVQAEEPFLPALLVEKIAISDAQSYAETVEKINDSLRDSHSIPLFLRGYASFSTSGEIVSAFSLSPSSSMANLRLNAEVFANAPELQALRSELAAKAQFSEAIYLKAVRFDGTNTPGVLLNSLVATTDEAALLAHLNKVYEELAPAVPAFEEVHINVFRVVAGKEGFTHLVSINAASDESAGQALDLLTDPQWSLGQVSRIIETTLYHELVP